MELVRILLNSLPLVFIYLFELGLAAVCGPGQPSGETTKVK